MTVVLVEGFDHEASYTPTIYDPGNALPPGLGLKGWLVFDTGTAQRHLTMNPGRITGGAFVIDKEISAVDGFTWVYKFLPATLTTLTAGFAFKPSSAGEEGSVLPPAGSSIFELGNGTTAIVGVSCDPSGRVSATGTALGAPVLQLDVWHYIEVSVVVAGASSTVAINIDGAAYIPATTCNLGSTGINTVGPACIKQFGFEIYFVWDDIIVGDGGFLGDTMVVTHYPVNDGTHHDWTPLSGSSHWQQVHEHVFDGDASYVHSQTPGDEDSYLIGDPTMVPADSPIYAVQLNLGARKNEAGTRTLSPLIRQGGVDHLDSARALSSDYLFFSWLLAQDPTGSDWTYSTVAADEFGMKLVT